LFQGSWSNLFSLFIYQNRYGTKVSAEKKTNSEKKHDNQEKKLINQEKRTFRIRDKSYIDRDSEYLLQENEPDVTLDQKLLEDLQKKKTDVRYIEMQVMGSTCPSLCTLERMYLWLKVAAWY
jgi:ATP-dependent RNA helicase DHX36